MSRSVGHRCPVLRDIYVPCIIASYTRYIIYNYISAESVQSQRAVASRRAMNRKRKKKGTQGNPGNLFGISFAELGMPNFRCIFLS